MTEPTKDALHENRIDEAFQILGQALYVAKGDGFVERFDTLGVLGETIRALQAEVEWLRQRIDEKDQTIRNTTAVCNRAIDERNTTRDGAEDLQAEVERLRAYAGHLEWCSTCAEDGIESCIEGRDLRAAATRERRCVHGELAAMSATPAPPRGLTDERDEDDEAPSHELEEVH